MQLLPYRAALLLALESWDAAPRPYLKYALSMRSVCHRLDVGRTQDSLYVTGSSRRKEVLPV